MKQITYPASKRTETRSEIFEQQHGSQNWFSIECAGWHLPATKEKHDWCGSWSYRGCLNMDGHAGTVYEGHGFLKTYERSCFRADCEYCFKKWLGRQSNKATRRTEQYEKNTKNRVKHIVISVPSWEYGKSKKEQAKQARIILKELNCLGGSMIYHPFRYNREAKRWYYSPHFHVLGFGWLDCTADAYQKYGYVVKNLGFRDSTFSTFYYILSHAGIRKGSHTLTWFGDLSYSKLKVDDLGIEDQLCPYCGEELNELCFIGDISHKPPDVDCEIPIDVDDFATVQYEKCEDFEPSFEFHQYGMTNSIIEQLAC